MSASGINNVTDDGTLRNAMKENVDEFDTVTYRKLGDNWFALSGYKSGDVVYIKCWVGKGSINHLHLQYPSVLQSDYDDVVKRIVKSFRSGDLSSGH